MIEPVPQAVFKTKMKSASLFCFSSHPIYPTLLQAMKSHDVRRAMCSHIREQSMKRAVDTAGRGMNVGDGKPAWVFLDEFCKFNCESQFGKSNGNGGLCREVFHEDVLDVVSGLLEFPSDSVCHAGHPSLAAPRNVSGCEDSHRRSPFVRRQSN